MSKHKKPKERSIEKTDVQVPESAEVPVSVSEWTDHLRPVWRPFPGPRHPDVALRIAMERRAYSDLLAHAKESLDVEVCGVLVGDVCEDDQGLFVHVKATIRGEAARAAGAHVTYTQETWTRIHREMAETYPKKAIVGWYHTHPGFGVTFSEMDAFVHRSFFSAPTHVAMVLDPLSGQEAVGINGQQGFEYVGRFWVDGRERRAATPAVSPPPGASGAGPSMASTDAVERLERRVTQLVSAVEDQRVLFRRVTLTVGMVVATAVIAWTGYSVWMGLVRDREPPRLMQYVPIPIRVGDRSVLMGVGIVEWKVPPELDAAYVELEKRRREQEHADSVKNSHADSLPKAPSNLRP